MTVPFDEKKARDLLSSRGYIVIAPASEETAKPILGQINNVVAVIGSRIKIAEILGISRAAVHAWDKRGSIPTDRAAALAKWARENAPEHVDRLIAALRSDDHD